MEGVVAVVRQVALLPVGPGSAWRSAVPDSDLTELLVDLEALQAQLLHLLQGTERQPDVGRKSWYVRYVINIIYPSTINPPPNFFNFDPCSLESLPEASIRISRDTAARTTLQRHAENFFVLVLAVKPLF